MITREDHRKVAVLTLSHGGLNLPDIELLEAKLPVVAAVNGHAVVDGWVAGYLESAKGRDSARESDS